MTVDSGKPVSSAIVPPDFADEFAIASVSEIEDLQTATVALCEKGRSQADVVNRLVSAGWSQGAARWYVDEVFRVATSVVPVVPATGGSAHYLRPAAEPKLALPWQVAFVRVMGVVDILLGMASIIGLGLLYARPPGPYSASSLGSLPLYIAGVVSLLFLITGWLLVTVNQRSSPPRKLVLNLMEYLMLAVGILTIGGQVYTLLTNGRASPFSVVLLAFPVSWKAAQYLRRQLKPE